MRYEYDVFGAVRSETGTSDNVRKFTGKEYESDVKLYYYGARYYDPYTGRFNQRDPAGDGANWYIYVGNNPLAFIDPFGLRALSALETSAVNFVFGGSVDTSSLDIEIVEGLEGGRGLYLGNGQIQIRASVYEAAGLNENSTAQNTDVLDASVIHALSIVVHEAAHHWQDTNNLYSRNVYSAAKPNQPFYAFSFDQLSSLNLGREQHASAAGAYFALNWQMGHGASDINLDVPAIGRFRFNGVHAGDPVSFNSVKDGWGATVNRQVAGSLLWNFNPLINQLRNPIPGPLRPTTWAGIR